MNFMRKLVIFLLFLCEEINSTPTYTILAPQTLKRTDDYNVLIAFDGITGETNISCSLEINGQSSEKHVQSLEFNPDRKIRNFNPVIGSKLTPGTYNLVIESVGEVKLGTGKIVVPIKFDYEKYVILVQTDRAIYRPGEDVQLRVIVMDEQLLPVDNDLIPDLTISIMEPGGFKLKEIFINNKDNTEKQNKFNFIDGVSEDITFKLHEASQEGDWQIQVQTNQQNEIYTLKVYDYKTPLVTLDAHIPDYITLVNKSLNYNINVFYAFGKPVKGEVELTLYKLKDCDDVVLDDTIHIWTKQIDPNGQVKDVLDLDDTHFIFANCTNYIMNLTFSAKDNTTGSVYTDSLTFEIIQNQYEVQIHGKSFFRPGKDLIQTIQINTKGGVALNSEELMEFECQAYLEIDPSKLQRLIATNIRPSNEGLDCIFPTLPTYKKVVMKVVRKDDPDTVYQQKDILFNQNCIDNYLEIKLQNEQEELLVGETVKFVVKSNTNIDSAMMYIVVRGNIIKSELVHFETPGSVQILPVSLTREMMPEAVISVFMKINGNDYIISDAKRIEVKGQLFSDVEIDVDTPVLDAGGLAKMTIKANTDSRVFLLAVDESLDAIYRGNEVTEKRVLSKLNQEHFINSGTDIFSQTGMTFKSNTRAECGGTYYSGPNVYKSNIVVDDDLVGLDDDVSQKPADYVRKNLIQTWIWDTISMTHPYTQVAIESKVPDSITTWRISAFSMNKEKGLGLSKTPGYVKVYKDFFVKLTLPYSIRRTEQSEMNIVIFNYYNSTLKVKLDVMDNSTIKGDLQIKDCYQEFELKSQAIKNINCKFESESSGSFNITAVVTGTDQANNLTMIDIDQHKLLVINEGQTQEMRIPIMFDLSQVKIAKNQQVKIVPIEFPEVRVNGSEKLIITTSMEKINTEWDDQIHTIIDSSGSATFDFSQPALNCQQRVGSYFPKAYWLDFIRATKKETAANMQDGKSVIQKTVDTLCWQNPYDGSIAYLNAWGPKGAVVSGDVALNSAKSNVWLTAYTLNYIKLAKNYAFVNSQKVKDISIWLKRLITDQGLTEISPEFALFPTPTTAYLTAYVRIAMEGTGEFIEGIDNWLENTYPSLTDNLEKITSCYAFHLSKGNLQDTCFNEAINRMQTNVSTGYFWIDAKGLPDLHQTSYGLMLLIKRNSRELALNVFKYIISRHEAHGYFLNNTVFPTVTAYDSNNY